MYSHCVNGGWILGSRIDGIQAEYVRIPFADTSLYHIPAGADEDALGRPTSNAAGATARSPGSTIAIGLAALLNAGYQPTIGEGSRRWLRSTRSGTTM